jgi:hypothetical protein
MKPSILSCGGGLTALCLLLAHLPIMAHEAEFNVHSQSELASRGDALMQRVLESPTGKAVETLDDHWSHWLLLTARARTGESDALRLSLTARPNDNSARCRLRHPR